MPRSLKGALFFPTDSICAQYADIIFICLFVWLLAQALQQLSNGKPVPYGATLRVVHHEGSRAPLQGAAKVINETHFVFVSTL